MKNITELTIDNSPISSRQTLKEYFAHGDEGACFTIFITNEDNNFYNFPSNSSYSTTPAIAFTSTPTQMDVVTIGKSGVYSSGITFPVVTDDDKYQITLLPVKDTVLADSFSSGSTYTLPYVYQYIDSTITFSLLHSSSAVVEPSNVTSVGLSNELGKGSNASISVNWPITLSSGNFVIARQPVSSDFEFTTTKDTFNGGSGTSLELKDITGLSVGMSVSGTGIASGSVISTIHKGYYDATNSTSLRDIYIIPSVVETVNGVDSLTLSKGGTVIIDKSSTFVTDRTLTFTGKGLVSLKEFNNSKISLKNLLLTIDPVVTTTDAAVSNSTTIPITSTNGIKVADTVLMTGIGVTASSPHVDAVSNGVNVTVSSAQTLENGQAVTFTGSSRSASVSFDALIEDHGKSSFTLTLNLDNILTVE
jgi:hypothetical protein